MVYIAPSKNVEKYINQPKNYMVTVINTEFSRTILTQYILIPHIHLHA